MMGSDLRTRSYPPHLVYLKVVLAILSKSILSSTTFHCFCHSCLRYHPLSAGPPLELARLTFCFCSKLQAYSGWEDPPRLIKSLSSAAWNRLRLPIIIRIKPQTNFHDNTSPSWSFLLSFPQTFRCSTHTGLFWVFKLNFVHWGTLFPQTLMFFRALPKSHRFRKAFFFWPPYLNSSFFHPLLWLFLLTLICFSLEHVFALQL